MTTAEKWAKLRELAPAARVFMRPEGSYYVSCGLDILDRCGLVRETQLADDADGAVAECWRQYAESLRTIVVDAYGPGRRQVRWNPFTHAWQDAADPLDATHTLTESEESRA